MAISTRTVLVAGGGIGGLTAALLLARAGAAVTLVERFADPTEVGAGLLLHPNGLAVLQGLGLGQQVISAGVDTSGGSVLDDTGRVINRIDPPDYGPGLDSFVAVRRSALYSVLLTAVRAEKGVDCAFGTRVVGADTDGSVTVAAVAPTGRSGTLTADLVVAADGVGSVVRAAGHFNAVARRTGHRYLRAIVIDDRGTEIGGEYWTSLGLFGGARIDEHHLYFYADVTSPSVAAAVTDGHLHALRAGWAKALPLAGDLLGAVESFDQLLINDVTTVRCRRWYDGRLVLLGDAAHAMSPTAGQGANSAMVDAAVLTAELTQRPAQQAVTAYDRRRRPVVRKVQRRAQLIAALAGLSSPAGRSVRNTVLRQLGRVPGAADRMSRGLQQENPPALRALVQGLVH